MTNIYLDKIEKGAHTVRKKVYNAQLRYINLHDVYMTQFSNCCMVECTHRRNPTADYKLPSMVMVEEYQSVINRGL